MLCKLIHCEHLVRCMSIEHKDIQINVVSEHKDIQINIVY